MFFGCCFGNKKSVVSPEERLPLVRTKSKDAWPDLVKSTWQPTTLIQSPSTPSDVLHSLASKKMVAILTHSGRHDNETVGAYLNIDSKGSTSYQRAISTTFKIISETSSYFTEGRITLQSSIRDASGRFDKKYFTHLKP